MTRRYRCVRPGACPRRCHLAHVARSARGRGEPGLSARTGRLPLQSIAGRDTVRGAGSSRARRSVGAAGGNRRRQNRRDHPGRARRSLEASRARIRTGAGEDAGRPGRAEQSGSDARAAQSFRRGHRAIRARDRAGPGPPGYHVNLARTAPSLGPRQSRSGGIPRGCPASPRGPVRSLHAGGCAPEEQRPPGRALGVRAGHRPGARGCESHLAYAVSLEQLQRVPRRSANTALPRHAADGARCGRGPRRASRASVRRSLKCRMGSSR